MRLRLFARLRATITSSAQSLVRLPVRPGRIEPKPINPNRTARRTRGVSLDHLVGVARALAIRGTDFMEYRRRAEHYSALMLADLITLPHFSVSSAMSLPKSAGVNASVVSGERDDQFTVPDSGCGWGQ